jgi:hypothetical protein
MALEIQYGYLHQRASAGADESAHALLCLHRQSPATLLETDNCSSNGSREGSLDDLSGSTLADDSDRETLVGSDSDSKVRTAKPQTIYYGDIDLFLL